MKISVRKFSSYSVITNMSIMSSLMKSTGSLDSQSPSPTSSVCSDVSRNCDSYQIINNSTAIIQLNFENLDIFYSDHDYDEDDDTVSTHRYLDEDNLNNQNWELIELNDSESDVNKTLINPENDKSSAESLEVHHQTRIKIMTPTATANTATPSSTIVTRSTAKSAARQQQQQQHNLNNVTLTSTSGVKSVCNKKSNESINSKPPPALSRTPKASSSQPVSSTLSTAGSGLSKHVFVQTTKRLNLDAVQQQTNIVSVEVNISHNKSKKTSASPQLPDRQRSLTTATAMLALTKSAQQLTVPVNKSNVKNKKRITSSDVHRVEEIRNYDNDHDEDSSFECKILDSVPASGLVQNVNKKTNKVSFQEVSIIPPSTTQSVTKTRQTPPLKKFRKLRLFDTPHTPKTLIKKSNILVAQKTCDPNLSQSTSNTPQLAATPTVVQENKKIKTSRLAANSNKKSYTKEQPPEVLVSNEQQPFLKSKTIEQENNKQLQDIRFGTPPRQYEHSELKTSKIMDQIRENVSQTPKTYRRTPGSLLKPPVPVNSHISPVVNYFEAMMDVDDDTDRERVCMMMMEEESKEIIDVNNFIKSSLNKNPNSSNRRLFELNNILNTTKNNLIMNKKLQFDDSDNEDSSSCCSSSYASETLNKKLLNTNRSYSTDTTSSSFASGSCGDEEGKMRALSALSASSSALSFEAISSSSVQIDSGHNYNHFSNQNLNQLSCSSNSLFRPMSRFVNHYGNHYHNASSLSSNNLFCGSCTSVGTNSNTSNQSRSPKSPFQFNQLHANINPFTPTNSFNSGNIITNKPNNTLAASSNSLNDISTSHNFQKPTTENNRSGMSLIKQNQPSFKRCYQQSNNDENFESDITNTNEFNTQEDLNNNQTYQLNTSVNQVKNSNENSNDLQNSLPRNKRLALRQCLVSRYHEEFHEVCKLGSGEFGDVFKCINRLDGCTYAIKRSKKPIAGSALEIAAWKEVCAHAVLVKHNNIVQYYSAWAEADRMLIQNEYCNGGSLAEFMESLRLNNLTSSDTTSQTLSDSSNDMAKPNTMNEYDLKILLLHVAKGLAYMHSLNLVHLDIKPGNIFICRAPRRINHQQHQELLNSESLSLQSSLLSNVGGIVINEESGIESDELEDDVGPKTSLNENKNKSNISSKSSIFSEVITYKIGDLGHVTSTLDPHVEEGDCRYLPNEILQEQYDHLTKADVFALALTVFVCGSSEELPKNGDQWHWIRQGNLKTLNQCSERFNKLLTQMVNENPMSRPSASSLVHHPCIVPDAGKSKSQLRKELNQEKFKNEMLKQKVKKYEQQLTKNDSPMPNSAVSIIKKSNVSENNTSKFPRSLSSTLL